MKKNRTLEKPGKDINKIRGQKPIMPIKDEYFYESKVEDLEKLVTDMVEQLEFPQLTKLSDNLYQYRYKNVSYIGTVSFFEQVDKEIRESLKKNYGRLW